MRAKRLDENHGEIVKALRAVGCSVQSLAAIGRGCPDILVGRHGSNIALEIKDGSKVPSARKLTEDEQSWHSKWRGQVCTVSNVSEALAAVGL